MYDFLLFLFSLFIHFSRDTRAVLDIDIVQPKIVFIRRKKKQYWELFIDSWM